MSLDLLDPVSFITGIFDAEKGGRPILFVIAAFAALPGCRYLRHAPAGDGGTTAVPSVARQKASADGPELELLTNGQNTYHGRINGKIPIRMRLERRGTALQGVYRYQKSKENLSLTGKLVGADGGFELDERNAAGAVTGHFRGTFGSTAKGMWTSADGKRTFPFELMSVRSSVRLYTDYPEIAGLSGTVRIVPQEVSRTIAPHCFTQLVYPTLDGVDASVRDQFNTTFRKWIGTSTAKSSDCKGASEEEPYYEESGYTVGTRRGDWVAISGGVALSQGFAGGAGQIGTAWTRGGCRVASTKTGEVVDLAARLSKDGRRALHDRCIADYKREWTNPDAKDTCDESCRETVKEVATTLELDGICLREEGLEASWDAGSAGAPMFNRVMYQHACEIPANEAKSYFEAGPPMSEILP